jgi:hypothetical protein
MTRYKVLEGVHRCVAARLAGLTEIQARIDSDGNLGPAVFIPLGQIYSTKREIGRWDRRRDLMDLVRMFADETIRGAVPAVELSVVPDWVSKYLTPIAGVIVERTDERGGENGNE